MIHSKKELSINKIMWNKQTLKEVQQFPNDIKKEIGYLLFQMQKGIILVMPHSRSMPSVGKGCYEIRVVGKNSSYRVFYFFKTKEYILVFHAFNKKTQKTSYKDIQTGRKNLKDMINEANK